MIQSVLTLGSGDLLGLAIILAAFAFLTVVAIFRMRMLRNGRGPSMKLPKRPHVKASKWIIAVTLALITLGALISGVYLTESHIPATTSQEYQGPQFNFTLKGDWPDEGIKFSNCGARSQTVHVSVVYIPGFGSSHVVLLYAMTDRLPAMVTSVTFSVTEGTPNFDSSLTVTVRRISSSDVGTYYISIIARNQQSYGDAADLVLPVQILYSTTCV